MKEKSHVGMAYHMCPVCTAQHDPVVLIDTRLKPTLTSHEFAGWSMCPEHQKLKDDGFIALVVVTNTQQPTLENAKRTGYLAHVKAEAWPRIFNTPVPDKGLAFIDADAFATLQERVASGE